MNIGKYIWKSSQKYSTVYIPVSSLSVLEDDSVPAGVKIKLTHQTKTSSLGLDQPVAAPNWCQINIKIQSIDWKFLKCNVRLWFSHCEWRPYLMVPAEVRLKLLIEWKKKHTHSMFEPFYMFSWQIFNCRAQLQGFLASIFTWANTVLHDGSKISVKWKTLSM